MSMKAQINTDASGNITILMEGSLNYENSMPLRLELNSLVKEYPNATITVDMHSLDFVGSSGICHFVETMKSLEKSDAQIKLQNVKIEFVRVFKLYNFNVLDYMEKDPEGAGVQQALSTKPSNKNATT